MAINRIVSPPIESPYPRILQVDIDRSCERVGTDTLRRMFDLSVGEWPVPPNISSLFTATFDDIASPGNAWTGAEKIAIAHAARPGSDTDARDVLPDVAVDAASRIASRSRVPSESWVRDTVSSIGETHYVELVAVASAIVAVDTVTQLLGHGFEPLPEPKHGEPTPPAPDPKLKRRSAWVSTSGPANPKHALSAAPLAQTMVTRLLERLYCSEEDRDDVDCLRGLSHEQRELVAVKVSHANECFW